MRLLYLFFLLPLASTLNAQTQAEQPPATTAAQGVTGMSSAVVPIGFVSLSRLMSESKKQDESEQDFISRANKAVLEIAKARGLLIVLQEAVYADPVIDITDEVASVMAGNVATPLSPSSSINAGPRLAFVEATRVIQAAQSRAWTQTGQIEAANKAIRDVAVREGVVLVVQNAVYASRRIDLTPRVLEELER